MKKVQVYRDGAIRTLKPGVDVDAYLARHPGAIEIKKVPCIRTLERWNSDCGCRTIDGCWVEPDGVCEHGYPSWLSALGMI
jgi:hypothetical protein